LSESDFQYNLYSWQHLQAVLTKRLANDLNSFEHQKETFKEIKNAVALRQKEWAVARVNYPFTNENGEILPPVALTEEQKEHLILVHPPIKREWTQKLLGLDSDKWLRLSQVKEIAIQGTLQTTESNNGELKDNVIRWIRKRVAIQLLSKERYHYDATQNFYDCAVQTKRAEEGMREYTKKSRDNLASAFIALRHNKKQYIQFVRARNEQINLEEPPPLFLSRNEALGVFPPFIDLNFINQREQALRKENKILFERLAADRVKNVQSTTKMARKGQTPLPAASNPHLPRQKQVATLQQASAPS
jgi:hypothetical protein